MLGAAGEMEQGVYASCERPCRRGGTAISKGGGGPVWTVALFLWDYIDSRDLSPLPQRGNTHI